MIFRRILALAVTLFLATVLTVADASAKRVDIIISKVSQKMTVKVDGSTEYVWPVSTGAAQYETPSGSYRPFRMEAEHFSKEWDDAPMPHSIFFTGEGHAIHGSYHVASLGRKASHGCVRLAPENAAILFDLVQGAGMSNTSITLKGGFFDWGGGGSGRSFTDVGNEIDKVVSGKPYRGFFWNFGKPKTKVVVKSTVKKPKKIIAKGEAKAKKPEVKVKKVADECVAKNGKTCPKVPAVKAASNG
jgi:L,D-transpeptidase catalytic domain